MLAEIGPADAERTIVLMAHHDAAHTAFFFNPAITEAVGENAPWVFEDNDTSPPLMWPTVAGPAVVAAGAALGSRKLTGLGTFLSAGSAAFMAHIGAGEVVPGANDNGTGCIAQLAIARALAERPPENTRVLFLSTSEEALCEGMGLFMERHAAELPADRTFFLCLDTVGSPNLLVLRGEGMLKLREYPAASLELLDSTAEELGIEMPFREPAPAQRDRRHLPAGGRLPVRLGRLLQPVEEPLELPLEDGHARQGRLRDGRRRGPALGGRDPQARRELARRVTYSALAYCGS